jgi:polar amino acid transport system substrate-binding protein
MLLKAATITLVAEEDCPYYCTDTAKEKGFVVDIATHVFSKLGYKVKYKTVESHEEAIQGIREKKYDAILGASPKETPDLVFAKSTLAYSYDVILVPKRSKWKYNSPASLNTLTLGVVQDRVYDDIIHEHIAKYKEDPTKIKMTQGNYAMKHNLKKLRYEKVNALIDNQHSLQYFYAQKKKLFPFKVAKKLTPTAVRIAFSPKDYKAPEYARKFSRGLRNLKGTKEMNLILKKYGLIEKNIQSPK